MSSNPVSAAFDFLYAIPRGFEAFSDRYQHSIAAFGVLGTTVAVVVALRSSAQARKAAQPQLKAMVSVQDIFYALDEIYPTTRTSPSYVAVRLTNTGNVPVRIGSNCFSWRLPFGKGVWWVPPIDLRGDDHIDRRQYPLDLLPNTSETLFLSPLQQFEDGLPRLLQSGRLPVSFAARWLTATVYTDGGKLFPVTVDESLKVSVRKIAVSEKPVREEGGSGEAESHIT